MSDKSMTITKDDYERIQKAYVDALERSRAENAIAVMDLMLDIDAGKRLKDYGVDIARPQ